MDLSANSDRLSPESDSDMAIIIAHNTFSAKIESPVYQTSESNSPDISVCHRHRFDSSPVSVLHNHISTGRSIARNRDPCVMAETNPHDYHMNLPSRAAIIRKEAVVAIARERSHSQLLCSSEPSPSPIANYCATVPFIWEESPGKPRISSSMSSSAIASSNSLSPLKLPPKLQSIQARHSFSDSLISKSSDASPTAMQTQKKILRLCKSMFMTLPHHQNPKHSTGSSNPIAIAASVATTGTHDIHAYGAGEDNSYRRFFFDKRCASAVIDDLKLSSNYEDELQVKELEMIICEPEMDDQINSLKLADEEAESPPSNSSPTWQSIVFNEAPKRYSAADEPWKLQNMSTRMRGGGWRRVLSDHHDLGMGYYYTDLGKIQSTNCRVVGGEEDSFRYEEQGGGVTSSSSWFEDVEEEEEVLRAPLALSRWLSEYSPESSRSSRPSPAPRPANTHSLHSLLKHLKKLTHTPPLLESPGHTILQPPQPAPNYNNCALHHHYPHHSDHSSTPPPPYHHSHDDDHNPRDQSPLSITTHLIPSSPWILGLSPMEPCLSRETRSKSKKTTMIPRTLLTIVRLKNTFKKFLAGKLELMNTSRYDQAPESIWSPALATYLSNQQREIKQPSNLGLNSIVPPTKALEFEPHHASSNNNILQCHSNPREDDDHEVLLTHVTHLGIPHTKEPCHNLQRVR